jgi:hypothetical protein
LEEGVWGAVVLELVLGSAERTFSNQTDGQSMFAQVDGGASETQTEEKGLKREMIVLFQRTSKKSIDQGTLLGWKNTESKPIICCVLLTIMQGAGRGRDWELAKSG